jgi:hypothetical protein
VKGYLANVIASTDVESLDHAQRLYEEVVSGWDQTHGTSPPLPSPHTSARAGCRVSVSHCDMVDVPLRDHLHPMNIGITITVECASTCVCVNMCACVRACVRASRAV